MTQEGIFVGELIATVVLILVGAGVHGAVTLDRSKAEGAGWVLIAQFRTSADEDEALPTLERPCDQPRPRTRPAHHPLPAPGPREGDPAPGYTWAPVVGPLIGGALTALVHNAAS
jgi:glycerol uptake facilitator-like aquaporin